MNPETLLAIQTLIERFGFPVFVALCGLLLYAVVFRYMAKALQKKDADFLEYIEKRDSQIDSIVEKHNQAFRENTQAINEMRNALEIRTDYVKEQTSVLQEMNGQISNG